METGYFVSLAIFTTTYALFGLGLNLQWGFTGLINFGHIAFMTVGAYATVLLSSMGVPLILAVGAGALLAGILGLLIGLSTLRLREDYLAIVTIGVSEVIRLIAVNEEWLTNGSRGVANYPLPLEQLDPSLPVKLGMIALLTLVVAVSVWQLWHWLGQLPQGTGAQWPKAGRRPSPSRAKFAFWGYALCLVALEASLALALAVQLSITLPALVGGLLLFVIRTAIVLPAAVLGVFMVYGRFERPWHLVRTQALATHLALLVVTLILGLLLLIYVSGVVELYNYSYKAGLMWLLVLTVALVFWQLQRWVHSPWGRVLKAIREDEEVAKALGKDVFRYKLQSLMIGGAIAGIAGAFYAWQLTFINPDGFIPLITFQAWIIVVLGGSGNNVGTLLGAAIFWAYDAVTRFVLPGLVPLDDARLAAFRIMVIGLLLIVLMMWRPQGILGKKEELTLGH